MDVAAISEAIRIADELLGVRIDEKGRAYVYEEINVKRWIADDDPCEICEGNEELGWIDDDAVFEGVFGDIDGPEAHPNCRCGLEYDVKRKRVYI